MTPRLVLTAALVLSTAACSGPEVQLDFGGKAVPINVAFGKPDAGSGPAAPGPAPVLQPGPGGIGVVAFTPPPRRVSSAPPVRDVPTIGTAPAPPVVACPDQDPFAFPRREATNVVTGEVPEGAFPYRTTGDITVNGVKTEFAEQVVQTVKRQPADAAGRMRFDTSYTLAGVPYTVSYAVQPTVDLVPGEIGLTATVRDSADGSGASFRPVEPLKLFQLRAERGVMWSDAASDPLSGTTATTSGSIIDKVRVNACGQPIEAWQATVTQRTVTPSQDITAIRTLFFATGYGGLLVAEQVFFTGRAGADEVSGQTSMTIDVDPAA